MTSIEETRATLSLQAAKLRKKFLSDLLELSDTIEKIETLNANSPLKVFDHALTLIVLKSQAGQAIVALQEGNS